MAAFSSWPYPRPEPPPIPAMPSLKALLLCPAEPHEHFNHVRDFIWREGAHVCRMAGIDFQPVQIMDIAYPGIITQQIWDEISYSDIIFIDLSGLNPNVLIELGVASAWRSPFEVVPIFNESIHLLRTSPQRNKYPHEIFDIAQLRHCRYDFSTDQGVNEFLATIRTIFFDILGAVPREWPPVHEPPKRIKWKIGQPIPGTVEAPPRCHFNVDGDGLTFGAPYYFPASYVRLTRSKSRNCIVETAFKFNLSSSFEDCWIGIKVRSSNTFANYGHLTYVRPDGNIYRVIIPVEPRPGPKTWDDKQLKKIRLRRFIVGRDWVRLSVECNDRGFIIGAAKNNEQFSTTEEIPTDREMVECSGYPLIQTYQTRATLKNIHFEPRDARR